MTKSLEGRRLLPVALFDAATVRELDRIAIEESGIPGITLMRRAALACVEVVQQRWPKARSARVYCGHGNNAGDGYLIAGILAERGFQTEAVIVGDIKKLGSDASHAYQFCQQSNVEMTPLAPRVFEGETDLIIDALLGTGLSGPVRSEFANVISLLNEMASKSAIPVLAVDIPSGLNSDTGQILGVSIKASATVTFIGTKRGLLTDDGPDMAGEVYFDDLEVSSSLDQRVSTNVGILKEHDLKGLLPRRPKNSHKNKFGHILIVGGDEGMGGAVAMSAEAALRTGGGLVTVATHPSHTQSLLSRMPELMVRGITNPEAKKAAANDMKGSRLLDHLLNQCSVVVLGPGLGKSDWSRTVFEAVMSHTKSTKKPIVIDADGLNLLAGQFEKRDNWILTPHPGEAARLVSGLTAHSEKNAALKTGAPLDVGVIAAASDRFSLSELLQGQFGGTVVLKGVGSLIHDGDLISVCPYGNPGMSTAGMGDVLSGVLGALLGQGLTVVEAAKLGVTMHALAGDRAVAVPGERGLIATDLIPQLRKLANEFEK